jgi:subtilisin family serine protease
MAPESIVLLVVRMLHPATCILAVILLLQQLAPIAAETSSSQKLEPTTTTTYIVQMSAISMPESFKSKLNWYSSVLNAVKFHDESLQQQQQQQLLGHASLLHIYTTVFHGFSATLTEREALALQNTPGVLGLFPDKLKQLHTTHTPQFLGLNPVQGLWPESTFGADVIIGTLDTGIWPESLSFKDQALGPVPARWKGGCENGTDFNVSSSCNRKLIGAKFFCKGYEAMAGPINESLELRSPRDSDGHGTHTASTAAGRDVFPASMMGYAAGTARGMAPEARIAVYKVCWAQGCFDSDILAAFDQAVSDGVDVISLSMGGAALVPYYLDSIAIGAFGAMKRGIFVACSAGNSGPEALSVTNLAPWVTTVGASTLDRDFPADVLLSNNASFYGVSLYSGPGLGAQLLPLIYAANAGAPGDPFAASLCMAGSLDPSLVAGKIVLCDRGITPRVAKGEAVLAVGGAGMILANTESDGEGLIADAHVLPATAVGALEGAAIKDFIKNTLNPKALLSFHGTEMNVKPSPVVASFSSRGPNGQNPEIMKPDLIAPGVNILAAWTGDMGPTGLTTDNRRVSFNIISGTSMSCPHVSGLAALLKAVHPSWSPAAIRSALMTTASILDNTNGGMLDEATGNISTPFGFGAGIVQPQKAMDPGLIYDLGVEDYVSFLCGLNYSDAMIQLIINHDDEEEGATAVSCTMSGGDPPPAAAPLLLPQQLNYPSFSVIFNQASSSSSSSSILSTKLTRTVTNVGQARAVYTATVLAPEGVTISVMPSMLSFVAVNQKLSFTVQVNTSSVKSLVPGDSLTVFGFLTWSDKIHSVQSPIGITRQESF